MVISTRLSKKYRWL